MLEVWIYGPGRAEILHAVRDAGGGVPGSAVCSAAGGGTTLRQVWWSARGGSEILHLLWHPRGRSRAARAS